MFSSNFHTFKSLKGGWKFNFLIIEDKVFQSVTENLRKAQKSLTEKRLAAMSQVIEEASSVKVDTAVLAESMSKVEVLADSPPVVQSPVKLETVDMAVFTDLENELEKIEKLDLMLASVEVQVDLDDKEGLGADF